MLCIKRHSSLAGVWREALEGLREADLAESAAEVDYQEEVDVSVTGVFCGNAYMFPRVFGDEFGDEFGDSLNLVINLVTNSVMNFVNH